MPTAAVTSGESVTNLGQFTLRVGVDLTRVDDVAESLARFGERYARRLFTEREITDTAGASRAAGLAARFAAKEATIKALAPADDPPPWRSIEVLRGAGGACELRLDGRASQLAAEAGLDTWSVSLCHEGPTAVAVVAACGQGPPVSGHSSSTCRGEQLPWTT